MIHYKKKREEELTLGETNTNKHLQALNEMFVNYFGRGIDIKMNLIWSELTLSNVNYAG
jgi:hypothetical protein